MPTEEPKTDTEKTDRPQPVGQVPCPHCADDTVGGCRCETCHGQHTVPGYRCDRCGAVVSRLHHQSRRLLAPPSFEPWLCDYCWSMDVLDDLSPVPPQTCVECGVVAQLFSQRAHAVVCLDCAKERKERAKETVPTTQSTVDTTPDDIEARRIAWADNKTYRQEKCSLCGGANPMWSDRAKRLLCAACVPGYFQRKDIVLCPDCGEEHCGREKGCNCKTCGGLHVIERPYVMLEHTPVPGTRASSDPEVREAFGEQPPVLEQPDAPKTQLPGLIQCERCGADTPRMRSHLLEGPMLCDGCWSREQAVITGEAAYPMAEQKVPGVLPDETEPTMGTCSKCGRRVKELNRRRDLIRTDEGVFTKKPGPWLCNDCDRKLDALPRDDYSDSIVSPSPARDAAPKHRVNVMPERPLSTALDKMSDWLEHAELTEDQSRLCALLLTKLQLCSAAVMNAQLRRSWKGKASS